MLPQCGLGRVADIERVSWVPSFRQTQMQYGCIYAAQPSLDLCALSAMFTVRAPCSDNVVCPRRAINQG